MAFDLGKALGDEASLVPFDGTIRLELDLENKTSLDDVGPTRLVDEGPGLILAQGVELAVDGLGPKSCIRTREGLLDGSRFSDEAG